MSRRLGRKRLKSWSGGSTYAHNILWSLYLLQKSLQKENVAVQLQNAVEGVGLEEEEGLGEPCIPLGDMPG